METIAVDCSTDISDDGTTILVHNALSHPRFNGIVSFRYPIRIHFGQATSMTHGQAKPRIDAKGAHVAMLAPYHAYRLHQVTCR